MAKFVAIFAVLAVVALVILSFFKVTFSIFSFLTSSILFSFFSSTQNFAQDMNRCERDYAAAILSSIDRRDMNEFQTVINTSMLTCFEDALNCGGNRDSIRGYYLNDVKPYSDRSEINACIRERHTPDVDSKMIGKACCYYCNRLYNF